MNEPLLSPEKWKESIFLPFYTIKYGSNRNYSSKPRNGIPWSRSYRRCTSSNRDRFHYFHSTDWCAYDRFSMENLRKGETPRTRSIDPDLQRLLDVQACGKTRMDTATPSSSGGWSLSNRCSVQNLQEVRENWYVCCGALVSTIYFLSNPCFLRRSKIQSRGITFLLKTTKKILIVLFGQLFLLAQKRKKSDSSIRLLFPL